VIFTHFRGVSEQKELFNNCSVMAKMRLTLLNPVLQDLILYRGECLIAAGSEVGEKEKDLRCKSNPGLIAEPTGYGFSLTSAYPLPFPLKFPLSQIPTASSRRSQSRK
jgi:hypothetical protein